MLYDCMLVLTTGEMRYISDIKLISWTRARVIFTNQDDEAELFRTGQIEKCELIRKGVSIQ